MSARNLARLGALLAILGVVGAELALRRAGYGGRVVTLLDERLGWVRAPSQRIETRAGVELAINALGYRDRDWAPVGDAAAEARLLRVAVLGNSVPVGGGLPIEDTWPRRLEARLRALAAEDPRWDDALVMSFAVPAYGVEQMARVYEDPARRYAPDLVVASVSLGSLQPMRPSSGERRWPLKVQLLSTALYDWYQRELAHAHGAGGFVGREELPPELRREVERAELGASLLRDRPFSPEARPFWDAAQARMAGVASDLRATGGELVVLCMPRLEELDAPLPMRAAERWRAWSAAGPGVRVVDPRDELRAAMQGLIAEVRARGLPAHQVWRGREGHRPPAVLEHTDEAVFCFDDPEHLTARGHEVVARLLFEELRAVLGG